MSKQRPTGSLAYLSGFALLFVPSLLLASSVTVCRAEVTSWCHPRDALTLTLLVGVWAVDGYMKKSLALNNESLFADLSFTSFIFAGSRAASVVTAHVDKVSSEIRTLVSGDVAIELGIFIFLLFMLWLGNVSICGSITKNRWIWSLSLALAIISTSLALTLQVIGMI